MIPANAESSSRMIRCNEELHDPRIGCISGGSRGGSGSGMGNPGKIPPPLPQQRAMWEKGNFSVPAMKVFVCILASLCRSLSSNSSRAFNCFPSILLRWLLTEHPNSENELFRPTSSSVNLQIAKASGCTVTVWNSDFKRTLCLDRLVGCTDST